MDRLKPEELDKARKPLLVPGDPYLFVLSFGWALVAHYVCHETALTLRLTNASHFRNAGKDYGKIATEGAGPGCEWRYEGDAVLNINHVIRIVRYHGKVHTGNIRS